MFHLLSGFNKVFKFEQFKTDNYTFRFFYKFALWLHILFLVLLSAKQYFGEPIVCHTRPNDVSFQNTNEAQIPILRNFNFYRFAKTFLTRTVGFTERTPEKNTFCLVQILPLLTAQRLLIPVKEFIWRIRRRKK